MSSTTINFHRVVSVDVIDRHASHTNTYWVDLVFRDDDGETLTLTVFPNDRDTTPILAALAKCGDAALTNAYAEGRKDEREAIAPPQEAA